MWALDQRGSDLQCPMRSLCIGQKSQFTVNNLHFRFIELLVLEISPKPQENQGTYPRSHTQ